MKHIRLITLTAAALLLCCACAKTPDAAPSATNTESTAGSRTVNAKDTYTLSYDGKTLRLEMNADELKTLLGEPTSYFESESCAFQGLDKVYTYGGLIISTFPENGHDYILSMDLRDDSVETAEGVYIGQPVGRVAEVYSDVSEENDALTVRKGGTVITFFTSGGLISGITYTIDK